MIIPTLIVSAIFVLVAFAVTKKNAKYLLSGYNMMSESQQALVDIDGYIRFFRRFHWFLGGSLLLVVWAAGLMNRNLAGVLLGIYPLLAYLYFIAGSRVYFSKVRHYKSATWAVIAILLIAAGGVGYLFFEGFKNNTIVLTQDTLEITGMYGEKINRDKIVDVKLVNSLPEITLKSNGFAAGDFKKGYFRTKDKKTVKLFVNEKENPLLLLRTKEEDIYFSSADMRAGDLQKQIQAWQKR